MDFGYLPTTYPSTDYTNGDKLFLSLGSFWTQVFQEQGTLRGYTLGMSEELIQNYMYLIETLNSYSIKSVPVLSTTKWQPIVITKSKYNQVPFKFEANSAVFGSQPANDLYYANQVFQFGRSKQPTGSVYAFQPTEPLRKFSAITDRIISPGVVLLNGVDVTIDSAFTLYFNNNIFNNTSIPRANVVDSNGQPKKYVDSLGNTVNDEMIILWCYNGEKDLKTVYQNFGSLFNLNLPSSEIYKSILKSIFNLFSSGPTVQAIKSVMAAFNGITPIVDPEEVIEDIYRDNLFQYVITDNHVYRFELYQNLVPGLHVGDTVYGGDILIDAVEYHDVLTTPNWWKSVITTPKLGFSSYIFLGNYNQQLFFSATSDVATLDNNGNVNFPVMGTPTDIAQFHAVLNSETNLPLMKAALGLKYPGNVAVINPVDFIFNNLIKNNTALLKFNFYSVDELSTFFSYLPLIQTYLPSHVYIMLYVNLNIGVEQFAGMNSRYSVSDLPGIPLAIDGSLSTGERPYLPSSDPEYYKDYKNRLFCVSEAPTLAGHPLFYTDNLINVTFSETERTSGVPRGIDGKVFTGIPTTTPAPTNKQIPTVLLIDFS